MKRRPLLAGLAGLAAAAALPARAQTPTKIVFGYTAVTDFASVFVAIDEGYFRKRQLDVEAKLIGLNSTIPAAVQADSLQVGGPTPSVYLQSVDGGLDHVVLTGGGMTAARTSTGVGVVARAGSGIRTPQDFVGRKVGVPGLGAFLHVTFRAWLKSQKVDHRKVQFVEAGFPQHNDLLRGGSVDAVVTADPFMRRVTDSGAGYVASYYLSFMPDGEPTILYTAKRDWVKAHAPAAKAFQAAIGDAAKFIGDPRNDARVRESIGRYIKLPPEVLAKMQISQPAPVVTEKQLQYWVSVMTEQEMLKSPIDVAKLIVK